MSLSRYAELKGEVIWEKGGKSDMHLLQAQLMRDYFFVKQIGKVRKRYRFQQMLYCIFSVFLWPKNNDH